MPVYFESENFRRSKLMAEYHFNFRNPDNDPVTVNFIDLSNPKFTRCSGGLSIREQILRYSKMLLRKEKIVEIPKRRDTKVVKASQNKIHVLANGIYVHLGINNSVLKLLKLKDNKTSSSSKSRLIKMNIGIYVKKAKQSNGSDIPKYLLIYGNVTNLNCSEPFLIGIYHGFFSDPTVCNEILRPFVDEMQLLKSKDALPIKIEINQIICDALATSLVTCTSLPDSRHGCSRCTQQGSFNTQLNITTFPDNCPIDKLRTNEDFSFCSQVDHFKGTSLLSVLDVGFMSQFSVDYKHVACLGVMKRLIELWTSGKIDYRLNRNTVKVISKKLAMLSNQISEDFMSKPKPLEQFSEWDGYDFKMFLLYYGPIVLKSHLPPLYFTHFLYFHFAIRVMTSMEYEDVSNECSAYIAGQFLRIFVADFGTLYGKELIDYNVHNLLHLEDKFQKFGSIEKLGGFQFDSVASEVDSIFIDELRPVEELISQVTDKYNKRLKATEAKAKIPYYSNGKLFLKNCTLSACGEGDNVVLSDLGILKLHKITRSNSGIITFHARIYENNTVLYQAPTTNQKLIVLGAEAETLYKFDISTFKYLVKGIVFDTGVSKFLLPFTTM